MTISKIRYVEKIYYICAYILNFIFTFCDSHIHIDIYINIGKHTGFWIGLKRLRINVTLIFGMVATI